MLLTSGGESGDASRCRELGISAYLTKPVKRTDLFEAVVRALDGSAKRPKPVPTGRPIVRAAAARSLNVLLAEDNIVNQRVAAGLLEKRGHRVTIAHDGAEAVAAITREAFDVVLMDVQMPGMGGFEATAAIHALEQDTGRQVRIIAMTAHAMSGDRDRCLAAGMDGYLSKPVVLHELWELVEGDLAPVAVRVPVRTVIDREELLARVNGSYELLGQLVELFLADCPARLQTNSQSGGGT